VEPAAERDRLRELSSNQRTAEMELRIDPGFVHHRKILPLIGAAGEAAIDEQIAKLPELPGALRQVRIDHLYSDCLIAFCNALGAPTLSEVLAKGNGRIFCSTENVAATPEIYDSERVSSRIEPAGETEHEVYLDFSTKRVASDTLHSRLASGSPLSIIAQLAGVDSDGALHFDPLVMGFPWLAAKSDPSPIDGPEWWSYSWGEVFVEDIDELAEVRGQPSPADWQVMSRVSEAAFKQCLAEILGAEVTKDWGGEQSDLYSAHIRLNGGRTTAAMLLKGPADFREMTPNHLGKNNDQIYRLANEPAELLVIQHCHEIGQAVRATLRAFAIQPGRMRHYCLIDRRDSLRILQAYGKVERALELSKPRP
jgi:hypothetical protein